MSKADEMFEELGYEVDWESDEEKIIYVRKDKIDNDFEYRIIFDLEHNLLNFIAYLYDNSFVGRFEITSIISMQELQAINEKVKELGWNE